MSRVRERLYAIPKLRVSQRADAIRIENVEALDDHPVNLVEHLEHWAHAQPDAVFLAERAGSRWSELRYLHIRDWVNRVAARMMQRGAVQGDFLLIAADNSVAHAVASFAAMKIGVGVIPVPPSWCTSAAGHAKLRKVVELTRPRFRYFEQSRPVDIVAAACDLAEVLETVREGDEGEDISAVVGAAAVVRGTTIAKLLFTSGSSGPPKGVINTHAMLCAQQQQMAQAWPFVAQPPLVLCDWLPWCHTSGGNNSLNMVLRNGGTLYIDNGRPTAEGILTTAANLAEVRPTWYTNVPLGYSMLLPLFEKDDDLAAALFSRLDLLVYGGAPLSASVWQGINRVCRHVTGRDAPWASGWGLTETTSTVCVTTRPVSSTGVIGTPLPGMEMLLKPAGAYHEAYVRGPNVCPGYYGDPERNDAALSSEGFFRTGDLVRVVEPADATSGLAYVGRASECFKLGTGKWVIPGEIKFEIQKEFGPQARDVIVAGPGQDFLTIFVWLDNSTHSDVDAGTQGLFGTLEAVLRTYNAARPTASSRIHAAYVLPRSFCPEPGELTEKGSLSYVRFLLQRKSLVEAVYELARKVPEGCVLDADVARIEASV
ncbi:AMP-binding protein [Verminephrobacter aporrectodeae]|uniref:AMP-binding protein n=1 Tax=Verminephrobacter aporrectodeae TaxID=1110389 RepID=UPI0022371D7E|nr:AMP-binding protein [Verminephrobacter aporrectodeae]